MLTKEEPTIVQPDPVIDAGAPPEGDLAKMDLGGNEFAAKLEAAEKAAEKKTAEKPDKKEIKKDEPAKVESAKAEKGKTPLDVAPDEKKEEPPAVEEELETLIASEPPPNASASSKANHAAMRKGLERANATISELRVKVKEFEGKPAVVPAELEERLKATEKLAQEREAELERVAFERSPRFQKFIKEGEAEILAARGYLEGTDAAKNAEGEPIDPNVVDLAARAQGARRAAILNQSGMDASTVGLIASHLARADAINRERESAIENWKEQSNQYNAEQAKAAEAKATQVKASEDKVFMEVGKKASIELAPFQKVEGNDEWNIGVDERLKEAQEYFDGKRPLDQTSQLIYEGIAGRVYKSAFEDLRTKYNDLVADNERTKAARPGAATTSHDDGKVNTTGNPMDIAGDTFEANQAKHGG